MKKHRELEKAEHLRNINGLQLVREIGYIQIIFRLLHKILEILNEAIWAPNDGLREPWRFIYVKGSEETDILQISYKDISLAFLLVVATEETDLHKQEEDYAAICCLIQNFQLLAKSKAWHVRRKIPEWIYDQEQCKQFGIQPQERIVSVLEFWGDAPYLNPIPAPSTLNITLL